MPGLTPEIVASMLVTRSSPEQLPLLYSQLGQDEQSVFMDCIAEAVEVASSPETDAEGRVTRGPDVAKHAMLRAAYSSCWKLHNMEKLMVVDERRSYDKESLRDTELPSRKPRSIASMGNQWNHRGFLSGSRQELLIAYEIDRAAEVARKGAEGARKAELGKSKASEAAVKLLDDARKRYIARRSSPGKTPEAEAADRAVERASERLRLNPSYSIRAPKKGGDGFAVVYSAPLTWHTEDGMIYNTRPPMKVARKIRRSDTGGRILRPMKFETDPEARGFGRRMPATGAMIVVDHSGSMGIRADQVKTLLVDAPASTVVAYSGSCRDKDWNIVLLADATRIREEHPDFDGANACDLSALQWALENRRGRPVIWVCDLGVSGVREDGGSEAFDSKHTQACVDFYVVNSDQIGRCNSIREAVELIHKWRDGCIFLPEDTGVGSKVGGAWLAINQRPVGSYA